MKLPLQKARGLGFGAAVVFFLLGVQVPARANSITYTFTGAGLLTGSDFSYVSPSGFLSFSPCVISVVPLSPTCQAFVLSPTTVSDLISRGFDLGAISGFGFFNSSGTLELVLESITGGVVAQPLDLFALNTLGTQSLTYATINPVGTLNIALTVVPEPSGLALLVTGLAGLAFISRRKLCGVT